MAKTYYISGFSLNEQQYQEYLRRQAERQTQQSTLAKPDYLTTTKANVPVVQVSGTRQQLQSGEKLTVSTLDNSYSGTVNKQPVAQNNIYINPYNMRAAQETPQPQTQIYSERILPGETSQAPTPITERKTQVNNQYPQYQQPSPFSVGGIISEIAGFNNPLFKSAGSKIGQGFDYLSKQYESFSKPLKRRLGVDNKPLGVNYQSSKGIRPFALEFGKGFSAGIIDLPQTILSAPSFTRQAITNPIRTGQSIGESFLYNPAYFAGNFVSQSLVFAAGGKAGSKAINKIKKQPEILITGVETETLRAGKIGSGVVKATGYYGKEAFKYSASYETVSRNAIKGPAIQETTVSGGLLELERSGVIRTSGSELSSAARKANVKLRVESYEPRATIDFDALYDSVNSGFVRSGSGGTATGLSKKPVKSVVGGLRTEVTEGFSRVRTPGSDFAFPSSDISTFIKQGKTSKSYGGRGYGSGNNVIQELSKSYQSMSRPVVDVVNPIRQALTKTKPLDLSVRGVMSYGVTGAGVKNSFVPASYRGVYDLPSVDLSQANAFKPVGDMKPISNFKPIGVLKPKRITEPVQVFKPVDVYKPRNIFRPGVKTRPGVTPRQIISSLPDFDFSQINKHQQSSLTRTFVGSPSSVTTRDKSFYPIVPVFPNILRVPNLPRGYPNRNVFGSKKIINTGLKYVRPKKYTPSLTATVFNIRGKKKKGKKREYTGLELRPIL